MNTKNSFTHKQKILLEQYFLQNKVTNSDMRNLAKLFHVARKKIEQWFSDRKSQISEELNKKEQELILEIFSKNNQIRSEQDFIALETTSHVPGKKRKHEVIVISSDSESETVPKRKLREVKMKIGKDTDLEIWNGKSDEERLMKIINLFI